ncbi:MAG: aminotransferase class I/II-fold pyridoxal phosphate-dependent enzyme, partial [Verrucomicrobia bacterium]|nr:aminotransferase class I/II-fold pyridoxal phosphate-dependent enzyme [Verrucomicrobiota bacterium]
DVIEMRKAYKRRRNLMLKGFESAGIPCLKPRGAFYTFPDISDFGLSAHDFSMKLLEEENVAVVPGTAFGACGEGFVRCAYATATEEIQEAIVRIARFVKRLG